MAVRPKVAAIIPALNEAKTIGAIVTTVFSSPLVDEVIVVSDGSTDATAARARASGARVIVHDRPRGKGAALGSGVGATDAPILLFLDGDLLKLTASHIAALLVPVLSGACAMFVGRVDRGRFWNWLSRWPLLGGQRALRRDIFTRIPLKFLQGYGVEVGLNYSCRIQGLSCRTIILSGLWFRQKLAKQGFFRGIVSYLRMWRMIVLGALRIRFAHWLGIF